MTTYNRGDSLTISNVQVVSTSSDTDPVRVGVGGYKFWVSRDDVVGHVPRGFRAGDAVTWGTGATNYEVVGVRGKTAFLYNTEADIARIKELGGLRLADEK